MNTLVKRRAAPTLLAVLAIMASIFTMSVVTATPAHAHTSDLKVKQECVNGAVELVFTLTLANVPSGVYATKVESHTGTTSFQPGWNRSSWSTWETRATDLPHDQTTVSWTTTLPGNTVGNSPWEYVVTTFSNGYVVKSDTQLTGLTGGCAPQPKVEISGVRVCGSPDVTWTVDITDYGSLNEVDLKAISWTPAGSKVNGEEPAVWFYEWLEHSSNHGLSAFPPGGSFSFTQTDIPSSATEATMIIQYDFKGGPSGDPEGKVDLTGDCGKATAAVSIEPATCVSGETLIYGDIENATFSGTPNGTKGPQSYEVFATANEGAEFPGSTKTMVFKGDLKGPENCGVEKPVITTTASVCTADGASDVTVSVAMDSGVTTEYRINGGDWVTYSAPFVASPGDVVEVRATAPPGHTFPNGETTATSSTTIADPDCPVNPGEKVTYTDWEDEAWQCQDTTTTQNRLKITTTYIWDDQLKDFVVDKVTEVPEMQVRNLTASEIYACPTPPPTVPKGTPATCETAGSLTLTDGDTYTWNVKKLGPGTHTIVATVRVRWEFIPGEGVSADKLTYTTTVKVDDIQECLAQTGASEGLKPLGGAAGVLTLIGTGLVLIARRIRRA